MANNQGPGKKGQKQEQTTSDALHHMTSKKVLVLHNPDGSQQHIPAEEHHAMPSGDGKYDNVHYVNYLQDSNNIALPAEKAVNTPQSYTGLFIDDPQKHGLCHCRLHRLSLRQLAQRFSGWRGRQHLAGPGTKRLLLYLWQRDGICEVGFGCSRFGDLSRAISRNWLLLIFNF